MSELRKAAQQALEALEGFVYHGIGPNSGPALASLRAALAQPEPVQEPFFTEANGFPQTFVSKDRHKETP